MTRDSPETVVNVLLVNTEDNPGAEFDRTAFNGGWRWIEAPRDWNPAQGLPTGAPQIDGIIVFSRKYKEQEALALCRRVRECGDFDSIPLLVGVDMYQMPLANSVKRLENAHFIFTPLRKDEMAKKWNLV